ncbi:Methyl-CpG-binding domain-containing protein 9 putative isoform 1 [Tripterygium wilfordii]|uniref:Methyl-CpG-binding domain-containing protein 9 putative isoform 1 n=1 Tax=Tripterygium wilfordii TaxID=458696 RepID=A0A7J7DKM0_TRIWF|nr:methyl-CpG-binding domain-containing protein 9-like [Tripterygium wilfordii]XP_038702741.1 methyl-CpG-binding domain-containing protein 9-like [Tripterygium wilfordii]KAF5746863.1 Methyl-CpG-binding domain-containing protein 9 putative isoform 1 [Tripterygium wilfordii]
MELTDSTASEATRTPLGIDLNEIPSSSSAETLLDPVDVVRLHYETQGPPSLALAGLPVGDSSVACGTCGRPEEQGHVVVCDACEGGFHIDCAGMHEPLAANFGEWVCGECATNGSKSKRWPLGVKSKRILDINASPPSEGDGDRDGEGSVELLDSRSTPGDSFGGNAIIAPVTYSNFVYARNGFALQKASGVLMHTVKVGLEDLLHHTQTMGRSIEEVDWAFSLGRHSSNNTANKLPSRNPNEILQALKEFISERHGVLEEGWHVELRQSVSSYEVYAVYCSPDGKSFNSMSEVACYLGLVSNYNHKDIEMTIEEPFPQERSHLFKKRKSTRSFITNGYNECKESLVSCHNKELFFHSQNMENFHSKCGEVVEAGNGEDGGFGSRQTDDGFPVQFEDFFILSVGDVDVRPSYHGVNQIWPVGYRSCWHDRITGSLFLCEVLDGGDSGPLFKVKRCPCSLLPIPNGSTVLVRSKLDHSTVDKNEECNNLTHSVMDCDNDDYIQMVLLDPSPPSEDDIVTCLHSSAKETYTAESSGGLQPNDWETGVIEISVEESFPTAAWGLLFQRFIDACCDILKRNGTLKFCCNHVNNKLGSSRWDEQNEKKSKATPTSLTKFCSSPGSVNVPSKFEGDKELETLTNVLSKWLVQDRFGLDSEFVQEMIEQLPGVESCSKYKRLNSRNHSSAFPTVRNGVLVVQKTRGVEVKSEEVSNDILRKSKRCRLVEDHEIDNNLRPSGNVLCLKLPPALVGKLYQVWELFWRFHELLGLKRPFSLEELEDELINPWSDGSSLENPERKVLGNQVLDSHIDGTGGQISSSSSESHTGVSVDNPNVFIQMETEASKEAAQDKLASVTYSRCSGVALTKAHFSLLGVLISELQSKVAALVDPNFDTGESKSKRGRKKDVDTSIWERRTKLNMLPINELTWPELARRYILAVLSMEGNLDSVDIVARESGKVFRCLQGDGGVLCGSLTGVAGMETDALLLAEAVKKIFGSLNRENIILTIEDEGSEPNGPCEKNIVSDGNIPEWAQVLEPVRKLPTNVGTRIRKCVYEALEKGPPEWAKKVLEHSISKEVYKGNASGPTKKAVLSVLADIRNETLSQKSNKGSKRKRILSISDIIMRKCRIILRHAAAADDEKFFCTLLGKNLVISSDNDDDGFLGSPAMVSRPLDFRTIDLRLAVGAYGGSQEAFLEDVHELWNNVRTAFQDQPDMIELAEKLSQKFELLYKNEVVTFVQKILGYAKSECLSSVDKKEIDDLLASINDIPKAPWDEGVCKVCGIDKDDDSVLLCDKCDAEYHTYCLSPPLSRIPEGNWYCPSCVSGVRVVQEATECIQVTSRCRINKDQGTFTHVFLDTLTQLAAVMEENEYWEFSVDERTFLLKFLCDELLNSTLIRQHLEQCAETTAELQQKLRSFSIEWRNLKSREEFMVARAAKVETNVVGEIGLKDGLASASTNNDKCMGQLPNLAGKLSNLSGVSDEVPTLHDGPKEIGLNGFGKHPSVTNSEKNHSCNSQIMDSVDNEVRSEDAHKAANDSRLPSQRHDQSFKPNELRLSSSLSQEVDCSGKICFQGDLQEGKGTCGGLQPPADHQVCFSLREQNVYAAEDASSATMNEPQGYHLELSTAKNDLLLLQNSIANVESQLLKLCVRREFLGTDSSGRLYWASATSDGNPRLIVDGSLVEQQRRKVLELQDMVNGGSVLQNSTSTDPCLNLEGSKASCPFLYDADDILTACSAWVCYQADAEIEALINWLKDADQKEKELKESILQWQKSKFREMRQAESQNVHNHAGFPIPVDREGASCNHLVTKAALVLQKKYGPCYEFDTNETLKKRGKRARTIGGDTMYRCECLEPIWPSRYHCLSCHRTFSTAVDLEGHNDGKCLSGALPANEWSKELIDSFKREGHSTTSTSPEGCISGMDLPKASGNSCSELSSRLIKFQNEGLVSPFDFDEIRTKFLTNDSNKELVQVIGLISSNGIPLFVPSVSPYLTDSTLMLIAPPADKTISSNEFNPNERLIFTERNRNSNGGHQPISGNSSKKFSSSEISEVLKTNRSVLQCSKQRNRQLSLDARVPEVGVCRCVIPQSSLRPLVGKVSQIRRRLKINLLDMEAALPEEALRPSKANLERRWAWRAYVKSSQAIYEIVQASVVLEDMIKTDYLRNDWWYWSSLSAAVKTSTISSLALRIYSLDAAIVYDKASSTLASTENLNSSSISDQNPLLGLDAGDKCKVSRKCNKKRKEPEG